MAKAEQMGFQGLRLTKEEPFYMTSGFIFPKSKAPWIDRFNRKLRRVVEAGIINYGIRKYMPQKMLEIANSRQSKKAPIKPKAFMVQHVIGVLAALGVGLAICSSVLFWELFYSYLK